MVGTEILTVPFGLELWMNGSKHETARGQVFLNCGSYRLVRSRSNEVSVYAH